MGPNGTFTELKLADFGLACEVVEPLFAVCGTPTYVAPEILMETGYGLKVSSNRPNHTQELTKRNFPFADRRLGGRHHSVYYAVRISAVRLL